MTPISSSERQLLSVADQAGQPPATQRLAVAGVSVITSQSAGALTRLSREREAFVSRSAIAELQRAAGNRAVQQILSRAQYGNAQNLSPVQQGAIRILTAPPSDMAWPCLWWTVASDPNPLLPAGQATSPGVPPASKVVYAGVATGAIDRIINPADIDQGQLNVCGPAAVLNAEAELNPVRYANEVRAIFERGVAQGKRVNDGLLASSPPAGMSSVDWMVASAMRDAENKVLDFHGSPNEAMSAMTTPWEQEGMMEKDLGCVETVHYPCSVVTGGFLSVHHQTEKVNKLLANHPDDIVVSMLVNAGRMEGESNAVNLPNHWVRLLKPVVWGAHDSAEIEIFTWGSPRTLSYPMNGTTFANVVFSYVVGSFKKGLL